MSSVLESPSLVEEVGGDDFPRGLVVRELAKVDDGPVGEFGVLEGIGAVVVFPECGSGVEDEVFLRGGGVWVNEERKVALGGESLFACGHDFPLPSDGKQRCGWAEGWRRGCR